MMRIVKRAPSKNYQSDYDVSVGLINRIAEETTEEFSVADERPPMNPNDVLQKLVNGETITVLNPFGTEVQWSMEGRKPEVRIIPAGYVLFETYRGFDIGVGGTRKYGIYKDGESYAMHFLSSVPQARAYIDRLINSGFVEWFERYTEARAAKGLKAPPSRERAAAAFHAQRQPEDLVMDDLLDASRYSVEQQQDKSWAIMHGGGFVKGGFYFREDAVADAKKRIEADIECGVPVIREVANA